MFEQEIAYSMYCAKMDRSRMKHGLTCIDGRKPDELLMKAMATAMEGVKDAARLENEERLHRKLQQKRLATGRRELTEEEQRELDQIALTLKAMNDIDGAEE